MANLQLIFMRLKMDVRCAAAISLPDDLIDEFDDTSLLIAFGNFLVVGKHQLQIFIVIHFILCQLINRLRADAVIFLVRLGDILRRSQHETHWPLRRKAYSIEQIGIERITHYHNQHAFFHRDGQHGILTSHFG